MNDYRITYTSETGEESNAYVTERTESSARKAFNSAHNGMGLTIQKVELHRENTSATKQQERDTLEAIKKMVEELGPQSYLATAFEGCFEDAESNIENDFGDSYKRRCESIEKQLDVARQEIEELKTHKRLLQDTIDSLQQENETLEQQTLSADDLTDCGQIIDRLVSTLRGKVKAEEAKILENAEQPETTTFRDAVRERRSLTSDIEYYTALAERINSIKAAA